jgi:hypothetical protein
MKELTDRTYEQEHAIKEGHRNKVEDDYFDARPDFNQVHRVSFRGGFDRGWDAAKKDAPADRDVMRAQAGWKLAPIEPSKEMIDAGHMHTLRADEEDPYRARGEAIACYSDMLAAASTPAAGHPDEFLCPICFDDPKNVNAPPAEQHGEQEATCYRYRFRDPMSGDPVWRNSARQWNSQYPDEAQPLYTRPSPDVLAELRAKVEGLPVWIDQSPHRLPTLCMSHADVLALIDKMEGKV